MINEGIYLDLSSEAYHGDKNSISRTALMDFKRNQRRYWAKHLNPDRPVEESKPSWEFGTAFHALILEPHLFDQQYYILPPKVLLKDVGREAYDNYKALEKAAESTEKKVMSFTDYTKLLAMQYSLEANERAKELISGATYESSYFWKDKSSGLMIKSRPDILQSNIYIDLKTCESAAPHDYQREMVKGAYYVQAAMCREGVRILEGRELSASINVCVEKAYPHCVGIYIIDEEAVNAGHREYKKLLIELKHASVYNEYQDYEPQIIGLPQWAQS